MSERGEGTIPPIESLGDGRFVVGGGDRRRVAFAIADGPRTWVFLDGITYLVESAGERRSARHQQDDTLAAPMPATVTQVHVSPGQQVQAGDLLITLEAMKMELPIRAAADGMVTAVNCRTGEMVQPGTPLVELLEPQRRTPDREP